MRPSRAQQQAHVFAFGFQHRLIPCLGVVVTGRGIFHGFGQGQPCLQPIQALGRSARRAIHSFGMGDAKARCHQGDFGRFDPCVRS